MGEVLSCHLSSFGSVGLDPTSDRVWAKDRSSGVGALSIQFGHYIDALCLCVGELSEVSAIVSTQVPQWHFTDLETTMDVTSPDNVSGKRETDERGGGHSTRGLHSLAWQRAYDSGVRTRRHAGVPWFPHNLHPVGRGQELRLWSQRVACPRTSDLGAGGRAPRSTIQCRSDVPPSR